MNNLPYETFIRICQGCLININGPASISQTLSLLALSAVFPYSITSKPPPPRHQHATFYGLCVSLFSIFTLSLSLFGHLLECHALLLFNLVPY